MTLHRIGEVAVAGVLYHIPAGGHPDFAAIDVLEGVLTAAPSGRLYKALVESRKASRISGAAYALHDPGMLTLTAEVMQGSEPQSVLDAIHLEIDKVRKEGVTSEEVIRSQQKLLKQFELDAADSPRLAVGLSNWAAQGDWRLLFLYRDRVEQVRPEDVQRVASDYLRPDNRTVGMYIPVKQSDKIAIPATPDLAKMIGDYKGRDVVAEGETFDVTPEKIEALINRPKLPGGIKAAFLPKKTRGEVVNLQLTLRYGNESNLRGLATAAEFLPELMVRGTKTLSRQQMQDALDKQRADLQASGTPGEATFVIETKRSTLPAVLELLHQILREPSFPVEELEVLKRQRVAALEKQISDPNALAFRKLRRELNPYTDKNDPRYIATIAEEIELINAVTTADLKKLHEAYLSGQAGELAIVGDFDVDAITPVLSKIVTGWTSTQSIERLSRSGHLKLTSSTAIIETPDKANATFAAGLVFPMRDDDPDYPLLVMGDFILGGGTLSSRLGDRVRQKEGLSYGVRSGLTASPVDKRTVFSIFAICNPANMEKLHKAVSEELNRLLKSGVTVDELENAKRGYLQRQAVTRSQDGSLVRILAENLRGDRTMQYYANLERRIQESTPQEIDSAFRKYIDPQRLVVVEAGDFARQ